MARDCHATRSIDQCNDMVVFTLPPSSSLRSFSLIERVILSAGAMLIFSVYFHLTICPEGRNTSAFGSIVITSL
ncbi:hypothetical protein N7536_002975 [Penicillium majusculum]|nr:hypothetical protein N7536_002975 [Penicillium majusculum]